MPPRDPNAPVRVAPLVPAALAVVIGVAADRYANPLETITWVGVAVGFGGFGAWMIRRRVVEVLSILAVCASLAGAWHHWWWSDLATNDLARSVDESPRPEWLRGMVVDIQGFREGRSANESGVTRGVLAIVAVHTADGWRTASGRAALTISGDRSDLRPGEAIECVGGLALVATPLNPGEFDYRAYLRSQGVRMRLSVDDPSGVWPDASGSAAGWWWQGMRILGNVRAWSQETLIQGFDPETAPLASALLLGRREAVDPDVNDAFVRTGTTHLLAISGLQMQVLAVALGVFLRFLGVSRRGRFATVLVATVGYTLLVGLMPSVVRSAAMTVSACGAGLFDRRNGKANMFAAAVIVTLMIDPTDLFDVGCQLSFLAVAAIIWTVGPVVDRLARKSDPLDEVERELARGWRFWIHPVKLRLIEGITVSTLVWLAALPLTALRFHLAAPISVGLNLPLVPMTSLALLASGISLGLSALWTPLGRPAACVASVLLQWTRATVLWGSSQRWGHSFVPEPSWAWVLGFYLLLALATAALVSRWRSTARWSSTLALAGWIVAGFVAIEMPWPSKPLRAEILAVGHGLSVVIETGRGHAVLYDCGRMRDPSVGRRVIAPALWSRGIATVDKVILSHADSDHYNGLPDLLDRIRIGEVLVPEGFEGGTNPGAGALLELVRARGVKVRTIAAGECWESGSANFRVRHPPDGWNLSGTDNARSIVLEIRSAGHTALLTGDLEGDGLKAFVDDPDPGPPPDVFLAPHHGGRTSNPKRLYDEIRPRLVVVSQRAPLLGSKDPLAMIEAEGTTLLRTWQSGAVELSWTGSAIIAHGFLEQEAGESLGR